MLSILSTNINVFVDGILLGNRIGEDALAAINLSMPVYWVLCVVGSFFAAGTEIPAARAIGVGDATRRDAFFRTGFNASVVVSLVVTFLALTFRGPLSAFLCADEAIRPYVTQYNDLLTYVIRSGNITEELPGIPPLHLYLELGACSGTTISLIGMGISRTNAAILTKLATNTKFHLIHAHLRASFLPWLCFASVNDALHRLPPLSFARTKNPLRICTCFRRNLVLGTHSNPPLSCSRLCVGCNPFWEARM